MIVFGKAYTVAHIIIIIIIVVVVDVISLVVASVCKKKLPTWVDLMALMICGCKGILSKQSAISSIVFPSEWSWLIILPGASTKP